MLKQSHPAYRCLGALLAFGVAAVAFGALPAGADPAPALVSVKAIRPRFETVGTDLGLTGTIQARYQSNMAFRIGGRVTARRVEVGQHVGADEVLATLDPVEQQANVDSAKAALASAQALKQQAETTFKRQQSLIASGFTTRVSFDQALETLGTTRAQVESAQAALTTATEQLSYADLRTGVAGIIVSRDVEAGQVVQPGQTVFVLAQDGPRDAVFDVPETLLTRPPRDKTVDIVLQADPAVAATGTVREISPIIEAASNTVSVRVGLNGTDDRLPLGAAVVGNAHWERQSAVVLPWGALFEAGGAPAVWVLDDQDRVSLQPVSVQRYGTGVVVLRDGIDGSRRVVTAGVQFLYPGQKVAVAPGEGL